MNPFNEFSRFFQDKNYNMLVFDIETVPDENLVTKFYTQEELEEREDPYKVSLGMHKIVAFSYCPVTFSGGMFHVGEANAIVDIENELELLLQMYEILSEYQKFVTFNGMSYDVPVIEKRSLIYGLQSLDNADIKSRLRELYRITQQLKDNRSERKHLDLFRVFDLKWQKGGLSFLLHHINLEKHEGLKGSDVFDLVASGNIETLKQYALHDAKIEANLFVKLVEFLRSS